MRRSPSPSCGAKLALGLCGLGLCVVSGAACGDAARQPPAEVCPVLSSECPAVPPSYAEVAPIFAAHCNQCHSGEDLRGPWPFTNAVDILDWSFSINADLADCLMPPPDSGAPLSDADRETLHVWLSCGTPDG